MRDFQFNKYGVCNNGEVGYDFVADKYRRFAVLLAMDDTNLWHYGLDEGFGGYYPGVHGGSYANREAALQAGKEELRDKIITNLEWHRRAAEVSIDSEGREHYGVMVHTLEKALQDIEANLLTLF